MVGHGGSSAGSYLADPTFPIPSHCASTVATSTLRIKFSGYKKWEKNQDDPVRAPKVALLINPTILLNFR